MSDTTTTTLAPLTIRRAIALLEVVTAAQKNARVVFIDENNDQQRGTARHIVAGADNFGFLGRDEDVRNGYLRVTMQTGAEKTVLVDELIDALNTTFFVYDWS